MATKIISTLSILLLSTTMILCQYSVAPQTIDTTALHITTLDQQQLLLHLSNGDDKIVAQTPQFKTKAFFCVMEEKLQKNSNVAVRFRVGSLNYVNTIEGKYYNHIDHITNTIKP